MRIKKFIANTLQEGKSMVLKELGGEAVILSTRNFLNPHDNMRESIEIVAALDENFHPPKEKLHLPEPKQFDSDKNQIIDDSNDFSKTAIQIYNEINTLKQSLNELSENVKYRFSASLGPVFGNLYKILKKADFSEDFSLHLVGKLASQSLNKNMKDFIYDARNLITNNISFSKPLQKGNGTLISAFIGPTGSGKTTTLVKLAIISKIVLQGKVLIISADNGKIGGAEQLQILSSIASIPFRLCYTPDELFSIISNENSYNFIFIDTNGISHRDKDKLEVIRTFISKLVCDNIFLVLSGTTNKIIFEKVIEEFKFLNPTSLILTKTDEAEVLGGVIEVLQKISMPLAYMTSGQKIPDDIEPVQKKFFEDIILPETLNLLN